MVWGEFGDWKNCAPGQWSEQPRSATFITQWLAVLQRDYSHPRIIGWRPLNETIEALGDTMSSLDEEFYARFESLCAALLDHPAMFGYCYTQLTDVFQEQNGIFHFDRRAKCDCARLRQIQQRRAAIECAAATR